MEHAGVFNFDVLSLFRTLHGFYSVLLFITHIINRHTVYALDFSSSRMLTNVRGYRSVKTNTVCAIQQYIHLNGNYFVKISNKLLYAGENAIWSFKLN